MTAEELRDARRRLGMTQRQLANDLGISLSQFGNYERGRDRQSGRPCPIPRTVEMAVQYLLLIQANTNRGAS